MLFGLFPGIDLATCIDIRELFDPCLITYAYLRWHLQTWRHLLRYGLRFFLSILIIIGISRQMYNEVYNKSWHFVDKWREAVPPEVYGSILG